MDLTVCGDGILAGESAVLRGHQHHFPYLRRPADCGRNFSDSGRSGRANYGASGTREYGYLSVECQFLGRPEYLFRVPPGAFQPPPKVDSAVIRIAPRLREDGVDADAFLRFVSACFRQKRKTLRNNLAAIYPRELVDSQAGLSRRGEELSVQEFLELCRILNAQHRRYDADVTC